MKNFVQPGNTITLTAPYAVASGDGLLVGSIFGVASGSAALGEPIETAHLGPDAADDPMVVFEITDQVRETIQNTLFRNLARRGSVLDRKSVV